MTTDYTPPVEGTGVKATIQRFGGYLAGMIMPNIAAFIAWGLITALFIPSGWIPNEMFAGLVDPMIKVLLPVLIGYTGGRMVHGQRGAVVGAVATMGVVVGAEVPMFLGAMIIGPLAAYILKLFDNAVKDRIKAGFEMLVDNFSAGIIGGAVALLGVWGIGPIIEKVTEVAGDAANWLITNNVLPLASVVIEPAKVLFLNNAINHGVLAPLGAADVTETGKSILFMLESNPGPGLGLLLAYFFFGPRALRPSAPAAIIIQFFGGIHEIYFPYVLMKPRLILRHDRGWRLRHPRVHRDGRGPAGLTGSGQHLRLPGRYPSGRLLRRTRGHPRRHRCDLRGRRGAPRLRPGREGGDRGRRDIHHSAGGVTPMAGIESAAIKKIVIACDAGMGSSVMLASTLRKQLKGKRDRGRPLAGRPDPGRRRRGRHAPGPGRPRAQDDAGGAVLIPFQVFIGDPAVTKLVNAIKNGGVVGGRHPARPARRSGSTAWPRTATTRSASAARRWWRSGRRPSRTSARCWNASARSPPTWGRASRSRTAR